MPTADEFRTELYRMMQGAFKQDCDYVNIEAGELHRRIGGYPGKENRMPNCCQVMMADVYPSEQRTCCAASIGVELE
jgi:hypothetical protein